MKYLANKLEQLTARIESVFFIGAEFAKPSISDELEDLERMNSKEICKIFSWSEERAKDAISGYQENPDENVLQMASYHKKNGFLVKCHMPKCTDFSGEKSNPTSWSLNDGHCEIFWLYADTWGELVNKLELENEIRIEEMFEKDKGVSV